MFFLPFGLHTFRFIFFRVVEEPAMAERMFTVSKGLAVVPKILIVFDTSSLVVPMRRPCSEIHRQW